MNPTAKRLNPDAVPVKKRATTKPKKMPYTSDEEFVPKNQAPTGLYLDFLNELSKLQNKKP